jgi:hypothetical protein
MCASTAACLWALQGERGCEDAAVSALRAGFGRDEAAVSALRAFIGSIMHWVGFGFGLRD